MKNKIKPLAKKHLFRNVLCRLFGTKPREDWRDLLADVEPLPIYFVCPFCGVRTPMEARKPRPDGRTIAQTIIDEVQSTDFQEKAVEYLKDVAPNLPEFEYKITAYELEKMEVMTSEEHLKKHQIRRL